MIIVALFAIALWGGATGTVISRQLQQYDPWEKCPWHKASDQPGKLQCFDGSYCEGIDCCTLRHGPARCPPEHPEMCARPHDCAGGTTRCCKKQGGCGVHGGVRECGSSHRCINVQFWSDASLPSEGIFVMNSGVHERLPSICATNCAITVCGHQILKLVNPSPSAKWATDIAVDGVRLPREHIPPGTETSIDISSLEAPTWVDLGVGCCENDVDGARANFLRTTEAANEQACQNLCAEIFLPQPCTVVEVGPAPDANRKQCYFYADMCHRAPWELPAGQPEKDKLPSCKDKPRTTFQRTKSVTWTRRTHEKQKECYPEEEWRAQSWRNWTGVFERCGSQGVCNADLKCVKGCNADEQCERYPFQLCRKVEDSTGGVVEERQCKHKNLFEYDAVPDSVTAIAFFIISGLALSAGIGGGGLYVPLLMICLGFKTKAATGLSQALLSGGSSAALIYNMRQKHPSGNRPMVDYALATIMAPMLVCGAMIGTTLNQSSPSWLILALLTIILSDASRKTIKKAIKTLREERKGIVRGMKSDTRVSKNPIAKCLGLCGIGRYQRHEDRDSGSLKESTQTAAPAPEVVGKNQEIDMCEIDLKVSSGGDTGSTEQAVELQDVARQPSQVSESSSQQSTPEGKPQFPKGDLLMLGTVWVTVLTSIFLRGGKGSEGVVPNCSFAYWIITAVCCGLLLLLGTIAVCKAVSEQKGKELVEGEVEWTWPEATKLAAWSLMAGVLAALCGIGGGMVMGPKLLDMGFLPQVQSATTATTLFILSTSAASAFLVAGSAPADYAAFLATATALGAVFGKAVISYLVKLYRRPSIIVFILAFIITASVIIMTINGIIDVVNDAKQGNTFGFIDPCE